MWDYFLGFEEFFLRFLPLYLASALFSATLEQSGAIDGFISWLLFRFGRRHSLLCLGFFSFLMILGGLKPAFLIFTLYPFFKLLSERTGLPPALFPACLLGYLTPAQMLPGTTQLQNLLPTAALQISGLAAPTPGILSCLFTLFLVAYYLTRKTRPFLLHPVDKSRPFYSSVSFLPMLAVIFILLLSVNFLPVPTVISIFLCCGGLLLFYPPQKGVASLIGISLIRARIVFLPAALAGFAAVLQTSASLSSFLVFLQKNSGGNPLVFAFLTGALFAALLGSSSGALSFALKVLQPFSQFGASAPFIGRFLSLGTLTFDTLPQNSVIALSVKHCQTTYRESYPPLFVVTVLCPFLAGCLSLLIHLAFETFP